MTKKERILWLFLGAVITVVFFLPIIFSDYQQYVLALMEQSPYLAPFVIILFRFIGVVLAPLPGAPIAFASMALMPWHIAWFYNFVGFEIGSITAFLIARKFREPVVARFAPLEKIHQWQNKISHKKQLWGFVGLRTASLVVFDFVSYAAGLTKLPFWIFLTASLIVDIPASLLFFYFGGLAVGYGVFLLIAFAIIFAVLLWFWGKVWNKNEV